MKRNVLVVLAVIGCLGAAAGCGLEVTTGAGPDGSWLPTTSMPRTVNTDPKAPIALVQTKSGLAGVPVGSNAPRWVVPNAVAAPDGSAIYVVDNDGDTAMHSVFSRIDPRAGARTRVGEWWVPGGKPMHAYAVEPGGARVALASFSDDRTLLLPFDPSSGGPTAKPTFEGHLEPEAFSTDRQRVFAARSYGDHYRIATLFVPAAEQYDTAAYDKAAPPEDMYGYVIQSVLTPDRTKLATLYRDPHADDHTAFVHLLDLNAGITICIDLPAPFGTGAAGTDAVRVNEDGTISVGHRDVGETSGLTATIDPAKLLREEPQRHYHEHPHPDANPPALPPGVAQVDGFVRFIAVVD